ncbi:unnamed protein product [Lampetra planeri]
MASRSGRLCARERRRHDRYRHRESNLSRRPLPQLGVAALEQHRWLSERADERDAAAGRGGGVALPAAVGMVCTLLDTRSPPRLSPFLARSFISTPQPFLVELGAVATSSFTTSTLTIDSNGRSTPAPPHDDAEDKMSLGGGGLGKKHRGRASPQGSQRGGRDLQRGSQRANLVQQNGQIGRRCLWRPESRS